MMPLLTLYADFMGSWAGLWSAYLLDLSVMEYYHET